MIMLWHVIDGFPKTRNLNIRYVSCEAWCEKRLKHDRMTFPSCKNHIRKL
jgi:hypothetical protein